MKKVRFTVTTDEDLVKAVKELCEKESRSFSQQVSVLIKESLERRAAQK